MPHVLVVDDERLVTEMLRVRLERSGWKVSEARTWDEAVEALQQGQVDILLTDHYLEDATGTDLANAAKGLGFDGPIVLFSASFHGAVAPWAGPDGITPVSKDNLPALWDVLGRYGPIE